MRRFWNGLGAMALVTILFLSAVPRIARAQYTVEEAEERMKMRQAIRKAAATTRPTTLPASWAKLREEDATRDHQTESIVRQKPLAKNDPFQGLIFDPWSMGEWIDQPDIFGIRMRSRSGGDSGSTSSFGGDVHVHGYYRSDGTWVSDYYRGRPDGIKSNNRNQ